MKTIALVSIIIGIALLTYPLFSEHETALPYQAPDLPRKDMVDIHFHGACASAVFDCFISEQTREKFFGLKFSAYLKSFGIDQADIDAQNDAEIFRQAHLLVKDSRYLSHAVVLAMDGVYDSTGKLDRQRSAVYFPNEYVGEQVGKYDNLLFGASINPERHQAIEDLTRAKQMGAVLIKWLPCTMLFDPADPKHGDFYRKLVDLNLPLLSHVGNESTIDNSQDELCDPMRLEPALKLGVTVIAAHMASLGEYQGQPAYLRLLQLIQKYPNLYVDNSATLMRNRPVDFLRSIDVSGRVFYGSDYPVLNVDILGFRLQPMDRFDDLLDHNWRSYIHEDLSNPLDKDVALKKAMGLQDREFYLFQKVIGLP